MARTITHVTGNVTSVSRLQGEAWAAWNASYTSPVRDAYRVVAQALYTQDVKERIQALFARSDEQNARLDALLGHATS